MVLSVFTVVQLEELQQRKDSQHSQVTPPIQPGQPSLSQCSSLIAKPAFIQPRRLKQCCFFSALKITITRQSIFSIHLLLNYSMYIKHGRSGISGRGLKYLPNKHPLTFRQPLFAIENPRPRYGAL